MNPLLNCFNKKSFDWKTIEVISDGSRYKEWVSINGDIYLKKTSKVNSFGEYTYEHVSEYLAMKIGNALNVPVCDVLIQDYDSFSKLEYDNVELKTFIELFEGFTDSFHMSNLSTFNVSSLLCDSNPYKSETIEMLLFDVLIGNSDRHPGNFMYSVEYGFYPLFDNGSSLCSYINERDINNILHDYNRFVAINTTKSKPVVRDGQRITHRELLNILYKSFPVHVRDFCVRTCKLDVQRLFVDVNISDKRKELIIKFLEYRLNWFKEVLQNE